MCGRYLNGSSDRLFNLRRSQPNALDLEEIFRLVRSLNGREESIFDERSRDPDDIGIIPGQDGDRRAPDGGPDVRGAPPPSRHDQGGPGSAGPMILAESPWPRTLTGPIRCRLARTCETTRPSPRGSAPG